MDDRTRSKSGMSRPVARRTVHSPRPVTSSPGSASRAEVGDAPASDPPAREASEAPTSEELVEEPAAVESTLAMEIPTTAMSIADPPTIDASAFARADDLSEDEDVDLGEDVVVEEDPTDDLDAKVLKIALNHPISLADVRSVQSAQASLASEATHVGPRK